MIYLLANQAEFEEMINKNKQIKDILLKWRDNYKYRNINKKEGALKARNKRSNKTQKKLALALYLLKKENKKITINSLAKKANVNWRTAKKFFNLYEDIISEKDVDYIKDYFNLKLSQNL
jgi:predicted transcriptional regulator